MSLKKIFLVALIILPSFVFGQARKPTIMIVPSDVWCTKNGFVTTEVNQGDTSFVSDYEKALKNSIELVDVIAVIGGIMADKGFEMKTLDQAIKTAKRQILENEIMNSKKSKSNISMSPMDRIKLSFQADIWVYVTYNVNMTGGEQTITFILDGRDPYTDKQIATASGTGQPSMSRADVPRMIEEATNAYMPLFTSRLQKHFEDVFENGREIVVRIKRWNNWKNDLETMYDGKELGVIIQDWISDNTIKHRFSKSVSTENMITFEQVRIPVYQKGTSNAIGAEEYVRGLKSFLQASPYNIDCKLSVDGLGSASLILGEK